MAPIQTVGNWTAIEWVVPIGLVLSIVAGWYMTIMSIYSDPK